MQNQDGIVAPDQVTTIRHVGINRGVEWIAAGFTLFMKKPGELIIAGLVLFIVTVVLNRIEIVGGGLATMLGVVAAGALMLACRAIEDGQDPLAAGQKAGNISPLWILSLVAAGLGIAIAVLGWLLAGTALSIALFIPFLGFALAGVLFLMMMLISIPVIMALWLAPGLVVFKGTDPVEAVRLSFTASLKNFLPFIIFYVLAAIATFIGSLMFGFGLIFVYPVVLCATYVAYQDIFATVSAGEAVGYIQEAP